MNKQINYNIRPLEEKDLYDMQNLFRSTVLNVNIKDYTKEEVEDWASCGDDIEHWKELLSSNQYVEAFNEQNYLIGFSSMNKNGYMHSMFVHMDWQGKGIATQLLSEVEKIARQYEVKEITSDVSKTARLFFEHKGYVVECEQKQHANRLKLTNYKMKKVL
ncbi:GNAT family N-acetyltransferase [Bacteroides caecigallinarum]|uniref:GNAT family N-acetyltransferase n=1 Tax=Bacteroides caecigallinarum TaxID=1411144 RepID=UPI00195E3214|nr:GNAT family N-acetyltransferase [Bacteroides caecigallinarum]MBM6891182.1 GNAT family N-acetyltransferase [Bacteroides caecigallinarum]